MSKIHVGVGEDFPVDDASVRESDPRSCSHQWHQDGNSRKLAWAHGHRHHVFGVGIILGLGGIIAGVALLSLAISQPLTVLGLLALFVGGAAVLGRGAFVHRHGGWHRDQRRSTGPAKPESKKPDAPEQSAQSGEQS